VAAVLSPRVSRAAACIAAALYLALPATARAHDPGLSLLDVRVEPHRIIAALTLAVPDAALAESDSGSLERFALESIALLVDDRRLTSAVESRMADGEDGIRLTLSFDRGAGSRLTARSAVPAKLARGHRQLLTVRANDGTQLAERMIDARMSAIDVDLGVQLQRSAKASQRFFGLGVRHMFGGYDYLLLLAALLLGIRQLCCRRLFVF
jgi:hypothetical protein